MVRWSGLAGAVACAVAMVLSGCQQDGGKPAVSLEQAKAVQANLQGQAAYTPPARSISDIAAMLDEYKPDADKAADLGRRADAAPPAGLAARELADFYFRRSEAAGFLGRREQQLADIREAIRIAGGAGLDLVSNQYMRHLMTAEMFAGNTRNALTIAEERAVVARQAGRAGAVAASYAAVGLLRLRMGDLDGAREAMRVAETAVNNPRFTAVPNYRYIAAEPQSQILRGWGQIAEETGDYAKAEDFYRRNLADMQWIKANEANIRNVLPDSPPDSLVARDIALGTDLTKLLRKQGRQVEAEVEARRVLIVALRYYGRYSLQVATALTNLTAVLYEQGRVDETLKLVDITLGIYQQLGAGRGSHWVASLYALRARAQARRHDFQAAMASWQAAAALYPDSELERYLQVESRPAYGNVLLRVGRVDEAVKVLQRIATDLQARLGEHHYNTAEARGFLAAALAKAGQRDRALAEFRAAVPVLLQASRQSDADDASSDRDQRLQIIIEAYIDLLAQLKTVDGVDVPSETFRMADAIRARGVQRALAESAARGALGDPALQQLARQEQDAQKQIGALYGLLNAALAAPPDQQDGNAVARLRGQIDQLRGARAVLRQEIERRFPDYAGLIDPRPLAIADARSLLRPGEALVSLYVGNDATFVWAVAAGGKAAFASAPLGEKQIAGMVAELRRALDPNAATLGDIPAYNVALAQRLHAALLRPVADALQGADTLLIVPDKALGQLPFGLLVTRPATAAGDEGGALFSGYRTVPFLIRDAAIAQLPSVAALATLRRTPAGAATRRAFAGFGDPWFSAAQAREAAAQPVALATRGVRSAALQTRSMPLQRRSAPATETVASADIAMLPRLPDTADEVRSIAGALHADPKVDVFLGADASEQRVKTMPLNDRRVVMFATHGLVPGDLNGLAEPALALSAPAVTGAAGDGLLTMTEILGLRLNADWVVLSACNTASGDGAGAEAVSGLGRAFFYAGTRAVLVTNWPVETSSARQLTTDLFRRQADGKPATRAQAMRAAMLALIDNGGYVEGGKTVFAYAHPIFWAPFSLVGDGGI